MPREPAAPATATFPATFNLLSYLQYTPTQRNQGYCGDCWVWASTGVLEVALNVNAGKKDRLSEQFFDSNYNGGTGSSWACCGGNIATFANFYASETYTIPWSNENAAFADYYGSCPGSAAVAGSAIGIFPNYGIQSITSTTITTLNIAQAAAIANIKSVLYSQKKAIYMGFQLATTADWSAFFDFWDFQKEATPWNPDSYSGHTWINGEGAGHAVLLVGWDANSWIILNSWGTTKGRPNGLFRMTMKINYNDYFSYGSSTYPMLGFYSLAVTFYSYPIVNLVSPANGAKVTNPVKMKVHVTYKTSSGATAPLAGATVYFYVDLYLSSPILTDSNGYASLSFTATSHGHTYEWYVIVSKGYGYDTVQSATWSFKYR
jgi:hypothetical protein